MDAVHPVESLRLVVFLLELRQDSHNADERRRARSSERISEMLECIGPHLFSYLMTIQRVVTVQNIHKYRFGVLGASQCQARRCITQVVDSNAKCVLRIIDISILGVL